MQSGVILCLFGFEASNSGKSAVESFESSANGGVFFSFAGVLGVPFFLSFDCEAFSSADLLTSLVGVLTSPILDYGISEKFVTSLNLWSPPVLNSCLRLKSTLENSLLSFSLKLL